MYIHIYIYIYTHTIVYIYIYLYIYIYIWLKTPKSVPVGPKCVFTSRFHYIAMHIYPNELTR